MTVQIDKITVQTGKAIWINNHKYEYFGKMKGGIQPPWSEGTPEIMEPVSSFDIRSFGRYPVDRMAGVILVTVEGLIDEDFDIDFDTGYRGWDTTNGGRRIEFTGEEAWNSAWLVIPIYFGFDTPADPGQIIGSGKNTFLTKCKDKSVKTELNIASDIVKNKTFRKFSENSVIRFNCRPDTYKTDDGILQVNEYNEGDSYFLEYLTEFVGHSGQIKNQGYDVYNEWFIGNFFRKEGDPLPDGSSQQSDKKIGTSMGLIVAGTGLFIAGAASMFYKRRRRR